MLEKLRLVEERYMEMEEQCQHLRYDVSDMWE